MNCEDNENTCPSKNPTAEVGKIEKSKSEVARNRQDRPSFAGSRAYNASIGGIDGQGCRNRATNQDFSRGNWDFTKAARRLLTEMTYEI